MEQRPDAARAVCIRAFIFAAVRMSPQRGGFCFEPTRRYIQKRPGPERNGIMLTKDRPVSQVFLAGRIRG
jgi:hypothetical protein